MITKILENWQFTNFDKCGNLKLTVKRAFLEIRKKYWGIDK